uniref:RING-type E3 ubiquitin transferase n=2 Tax=Sus scrofa TaxID=9823 RepID=A0A8D0ZFI6_PIG
MAMFRSLVASAQQRQPPGGPAGGDSGLEAQYSCPICLEVYHRPVAIGSCGHTFCGECLQPCLQVPSPLCPLCRLPFDPKKVDKATHVEKQLSSYKAPCRGCSKKVTLAKMRVHVASCVKVQEQMASCPKFVPVVPTSQPIPRCAPSARPCPGVTPATRAPTSCSTCSTGTSSPMTPSWTTASMRKPPSRPPWPCLSPRTEGAAAPALASRDRAHQPPGARACPGPRLTAAGGEAAPSHRPGSC